MNIIFMCYRPCKIFELWYILMGEGSSHSSWTVWRWRMGPLGFPETSLTKYQLTLRNIPEERRFQTKGSRHKFLSDGPPCKSRCVTGSTHGATSRRGASRSASQPYSWWLQGGSPAALPTSIHVKSLAADATNFVSEMKFQHYISFSRFLPLGTSSII